MFKQSLSVKDQFGVKHMIQATVDHQFANTQSHSNIKHITVDGQYFARDPIKDIVDILFQFL